SFNYGGQQEAPEATPEGTGPEGAPEAAFLIARESAGAERSPRAARRHLLEVLAEVRQGRLQLEWVYSEASHRRETVEGLAEGFLEALRQLIDHCLTPEAGAVTASDFELADLDEDKLQALAGLLGDDDDDDTDEEDDDEDDDEL
ncbi:MAG: hypothetical protein KDD47_07715, partial [Acidobacteria bacterium]|nr:hypothetical protein [Acidobacteriota bacterium]